MPEQDDRTGGSGGQETPPTQVQKPIECPPPPRFVWVTRGAGNAPVTKDEKKRD